MNSPERLVPTEIKLHQKSKLMEITYSDGKCFELPFEFLRVYSPSAEVRGHGPDQEVLQTGKRNVDIAGIEPVGTYAIQPKFSDGHDSGLYSWDYLYELGENRDKLWLEYLRQLANANATRDGESPAAQSGGCGGNCSCSDGH